MTKIDSRNRWKPLTFTGDAQAQEETRRGILVALRRLERESLAKARKATAAAAALAECDLAKLAVGDRPARKLLNDVFQSDDCEVCGGHVRSVVNQLIGASSDYRADQVLRVGRSLDDVAREQEQPLADRGQPEGQQTNATPASVKSAAVSEDGRIVDLNQIDWRREPRRERERQLRKAIIDRIEAENLPGFLGGPYKVRRKLEELVGSRFDEMGSDLAEAIARWDSAIKDELSNEKRTEHRRLLELARHDVDNTPYRPA